MLALNGSATRFCRAAAMLPPASRAAWCPTRAACAAWCACAELEGEFVI